jgi:hypothetical protein
VVCEQQTPHNYFFFFYAYGLAFLPLNDCIVFDIGKYSRTFKGIHYPMQTCDVQLFDNDSVIPYYYKPANTRSRHTVI